MIEAFFHKGCRHDSHADGTNYDLHWAYAFPAWNDSLLLSWRGRLIIPLQSPFPSFISLSGIARLGTFISRIRYCILTADGMQEQDRQLSLYYSFSLLSTIELPGFDSMPVSTTESVKSRVAIYNPPVRLCWTINSNAYSKYGVIYKVEILWSSISCSWRWKAFRI